MSNRRVGQGYLVLKTKFTYCVPFINPGIPVQLKYWSWPQLINRISLGSHLLL